MKIWDLCSSSFRVPSNLEQSHFVHCYISQWFQTSLRLTFLTFKIFHLGVWADAFYGWVEQFTLLAVIVSSCLRFDLHSFHIMKIFIAAVRMRDLIIHLEFKCSSKWHSKFKNKENCNAIYAAAELCCMQSHGDILSAWLHSENWPEMVLQQPCSSYLNNSKWIFFSLQVGRRCFFKLRKLTLASRNHAAFQYCQKQQRIWRSYACFRNTCKPTVFKSYSDWHLKNSVFPSNSASHIDKTVCNWMQELVSRRLFLGKSLRWIDLCMTFFGKGCKARVKQKNMVFLVNETQMG